MFSLHRHRLLRYWLPLVAFLWLVTAVSAQSNGRMQINRLNTSQFPNASFTLIATDAESRPLININTLAVLENGNAITDLQFAPEQVGVEIVFVLDANRTYNTRDGGDPPRREKVRDSLAQFANQYMSQTQQDRVWIVVPDGSGGRLLGDGTMTFPNQVINAINFYDPGALADTPMQAMMELALAQFNAEDSSGRYRAVVIFSDADSLERQLNFDQLVALARDKNVALFTLILGLRADPNEINTAERLGDPTYGFWLHMPQVANAEPLYQVLQANGVQTRVSYRSRVDYAGQHTLEVTLGSLVASRSFQLDVEPPVVQLVVDNSLPIRRVAPAHDTPLAEIEPASQLAVAQITWPDGFPRNLRSAALLVNGVVQPGGETVVMTGDGRLNFTWPIRDLDEGVYTLTVQAVDELGLESVSPPLPLTIEVARPPAPEPETTPVAEEATATPSAAVPAVPTDVDQRLSLIAIVIGVAATLFALFMLIVAIIIVRRRGSAPPPAPAPVSPFSGGPPVEHDATQIMMPAFALSQGGGAYLEPLENATDYAVPIQLTQANTAIGRDAKLAQIVLNDKSVSRLHARIMESAGQYRLYDEGSASGTYLNFERISLTPQLLKDNDDIHIGRVHLRFRLSGGAADADSTQIMAPLQRPGAAAPPTDESTQPFMPHQPPGGGAGRPSAPAQNDPDDVSTQPYLPHSPKR
jgi:hypothetical protein